MTRIEIKSELQNYNPMDRTCMVFLYGLIMNDGKEGGRFVIAKKSLSVGEYDLYMNQANQTLDEMFLSKWQEEIIGPLKEGFAQFEKDSELNLDRRKVK